MPTLSSILVQRGAASQRAVEDAIARQVFHGGDLATNLLEVGALREEALVPLVAESFGLDPAAPGRLPAPPPEVLRLVPGDLALRHGIFPLARRDRALIVAVAEPLPAAVEDDLGFALDVAIRQVAAPLVRVRQAIAEGYGIPLDRRHLRLLAKLDGHVDPSPSAMPPPARDPLPPMRMPRPVSIPSPSFGTGVSDPDASRLDAKPVAKSPFIAHPAGFAIPHIPRSPALPAEATPPPEGASPPEAAPPPQAASLPEEAAPQEDRPPAPPPAKPKGAARALAGVLKQALSEERIDKSRGLTPRALATSTGASPAWRTAPARRKGPFTTAMAEQELEEAATSEAVLGILFSFAEQFFAYTALFVVHGDIAEGREASGPGAGRVAVAGLRFPLGPANNLTRARERRAPVLARLEAGGPDVALAEGLGRGPRSPARAAALLPVVVRGRAVAILYGDDGDADVDLGGLGEVVALIGLGGAALSRIALRKKLGSRAPDVPLRVRIQEGAAALVRAVSVPAMQAVVAPRPSPAAAVAVAMFSAASDAPNTVPDPPGTRLGTSDPPGPSAGFAVSPPEDENPLAISPGPRTARYAFDEDAPKPVGRRTRPGVGIPFPEDDGEPEAPSATEPPPVTLPARAETFDRADRPLPIGERPTVEIERPPLSTPGVPQTVPGRPTPARRGPAPLYEGRAAAVPDGASVEWVGAAYDGSADPPPDAPGDDAHAARRLRARTLPSMGFEPLPRTPPPNATAWTSFPSPPPPPSLATLAAQRPRSERPAPQPPIPREEEDSRPPTRFATLPAPGTPVTRHTSAPPGHDGGPRPHASGMLPSVVVDIGAEHEELIQRVVEGRRGQEAFDQLVRHGDQIIGAVMARFPGPLRVDRHRARAELPAASQCGPILELVVAIRRPALPYVSSRASATDPEVRFWAAHVLGELRYPEAATLLVPRLFDDDAAVRRIARRSAAALVGAGPPGAPILKGLEDITQNPDEPGPHRVLAIETMGEIRSGSLVLPLLTALDAASEDVAEAARRALLLITRQDFGHDARRWHDWWAKHGGRHRIEWLIDALMHDQPSVRRAAGDELKLLTKEYFGYYDDLPKRERERAQGLYRSWWEQEGRQRFA